MSVYCSECLFFTDGINITHPLGPPDRIQERCTAPQNFKNTHKQASTYPKSQPRLINKFNNCTWFIPIDEISSSSSGGVGPVPPLSSSSS